MKPTANRHVCVKRADRGSKAGDIQPCLLPEQQQIALIWKQEVHTSSLYLPQYGVQPKIHTLTQTCRDNVLTADRCTQYRHLCFLLVFRKLRRGITDSFPSPSPMLPPPPSFSLLLLFVWVCVCVAAASFTKSWKTGLKKGGNPPVLPFSDVGSDVACDSAEMLLLLSLG